MKQDPALALADRQRQLLARSAALRERFAADMAQWQPPLALLDRAQAVAGQSWRWLRAHPEVPAGAAALLLVLRPRRAFSLVVLGWRLGRRAWKGWQLWQTLRRSAGLLPR